MINIVQLERNTTDSGVITVHWTASKTVGGIEANIYGSEGFTPDTNGAGFIPYESLVEADVIAWLDSASIEETLDSIIAEKQAPQVTSGIPWV